MAAGGMSDPLEIRELPSSGSGRTYYRVFLTSGNSVLAAFNDDIRENRAWYGFSEHFRKQGLPVPGIFAADKSERYFLLQDLGDTDLLSLLLEKGEDHVRPLYRQVIGDLLKFQVEGIRGLDPSVAYPTRQFDARSIMWDLNYFKYYFVKTHDILFHEHELEADFQNFCEELLRSRSAYFMYRDFQARNIMIHEGKPWYIDFQGGRMGPLPYDLVSLLYQAKANLSDHFRKELYDLYLNNLQQILPDEAVDFNRRFSLFAVFRTMQVLGAYGFRGIIQRKGHFLSSIPYATGNLEKITDDPFRRTYPELSGVLDAISRLDMYRPAAMETNKLVVEISSFSYKKNGYPPDLTENGGGFVFDCRALPNPGRLSDLKDFTGREKPVADYLEDQTEVGEFLANVFRIVDQSADNYLERGFTSLQVNFGCTGGKHRSVYSAERLKSHLIHRYGNRLVVKLKHATLDD